MSKRLQRLLTKSGTTIVAYENQTVNVIWTFAKNGKKSIIMILAFMLFIFNSSRLL